MRRLLAATLLTATAAVATAAGPVFQAAAAWSDAQPRPGGTATLLVTIRVEPGWHINSNAPLDPYLIPTSLTLELPRGWSAGEPSYPAPRLASFRFSPDQPLSVFEGEFRVTVPVSLAADAVVAGRLAGTVEAQACNDTMCLPPARVAFSLTVGGDTTAAGADAGAEPSPVDAEAGAAPAATSPSAVVAPSMTGAGTSPLPLESYEGGTAQAGGLSERFATAGLLLQLAIVFLAGLALNLTPCVYPLIPITVGFFMSQKETGRRRTWLLAATYVLGMSVTYSVLGVVAALTGRLFGAALQSPWVIGGIVVVILALAASMFGLWELRVPAWATRASGGRSGTLGALIMGLAVGLVAAPCIGPFVLGLLTYVGQRQDVMLGFTLFFTLALGLGLPYLFLAVFTGALERLPNSGAWMLGVRQLFGVLLIALAAYFVAPFLGEPLGGSLIAAVLALGGLYLLLVARPGHEQPWIDRAMRLASLGLVVAGVLLYPRPGAGGAGRLEWQTWSESAVDAALASGRTVIVDVYADWCAPCKELEEKTFSDPAVAARLQGLARFKVDLTTSTPEGEALRVRYAIAGVPTVLFLRAGEEVPDTRLTGFEPPRRFLARLDTVLAP